MFSVLYNAFIAEPNLYSRSINFTMCLARLIVCFNDFLVSCLFLCMCLLLRVVAYVFALYFGYTLCEITLCYVQCCCECTVIILLCN